MEENKNEQVIPKNDKELITTQEDNKSGDLNQHRPFTAVQIMEDEICKKNYKMGRSESYKKESFPCVHQQHHKPSRKMKTSSISIFILFRKK